MIYSIGDIVNCSLEELKEQTADMSKEHLIQILYAMVVHGEANKKGEADLRSSIKMYKEKLHNVNTAYQKLTSSVKSSAIFNQL